MLHYLEFQLLKIIKTFPSSPHFIVMVSGGRDSMSLLTMFLKVKHWPKSPSFSFEVFHAQHHLRGEESLADQKFVEDTCKLHNISYSVEEWNEHPHSNKQQQAREWRYLSARERVKHPNTFITTAHHARDHVETVLLHLLRGSGLDGLKGINLLERDLFRPLHMVPFEELCQYQVQQNIPFREDSSNKSLHYVRNLLREKVLPVFSQINPSYEKSFRHFSESMDKSSSLLELAKNEDQSLRKILTKNVLDNLEHEIKLFKHTKQPYKRIPLKHPWSFEIHAHGNEELTYQFHKIETSVASQ